MTTPTATSEQHDINSPDNLARRHHGLAVLSQIDGHQGEAVIDSLADINPALGHHVAAFAFGDIYDRPGLTQPPARDHRCPDRPRRLRAPAQGPHRRRAQRRPDP